MLCRIEGPVTIQQVMSLIRVHGFGVIIDYRFEQRKERSRTETLVEEREERGQEPMPPGRQSIAVVSPW